MRIYLLLIATLIVLLPALLQAQTTIQPERLTIKDGLSQGFISALLQDSEGFLWIGTKNGLNRYDGEQFEIFTNDPTDPYSISHDFVNNLYEVGDYLLVGTTAGGLNIFHKRSKKFYKIPATNPEFKSWTKMNIQNIFLDALGQIWIIEQSSGGVMRLRFPEGFWQRLPEEEHLLQEVAIKRFSDLNLAEINYGGNQFIYGLKPPSQLLKINISSGDWESLQNQPPDVGLIDFVPDVEQGLLVFSFNQNKILFLKNGNWLTSTADFDIIKLFYFENEHQLWVNTGEELLMFDQWMPNGQAINRADASVVISSSRDTYKQLLKDQSGIIWVATGGYGVLKIAPRLLKIKKYFEGMSIGTPPYMTREGEVIVSTSQGPLLETSLSPYSQKFPDGTWWFEDKEGAIWLIGKFGIEIGVYQINEFGLLQKKAILDSESYDFHTAAIEPETAALWVACPTGNLIRYEPSTNEWKTYGFQHLFHSFYDCYSMVRTANGHWWIGTSRGLVHGIPRLRSGQIPHGEARLPDGQGFDFELIQTKEGEVEGLLNNDVASLLTDPIDANILWLGTKGGGLHRLDTRTMIFTHLNSTNGLPNDVIYGVLNDDNGNLWMSSNKGIISYHPVTRVIRNFTEADGMQSNEFNTWAYSKSPTGELMFGGINGLNVFHPEDLKENLVLPKVWITGLAINNEMVTIGDSMGLLQTSIEYTSEITLTFSQNNITFEFAALEFSAPLKNRFRYYLEGAEKPWVHEDVDNKAAYLNLSPGRYTFKVKGSNGDGIWNEHPTEIKITILPPWYRSNLAYLIYTLSIGLILWQFLKFWKNRFHLKHEIEMEHKEAIRLKELDEFKSRLYTNITHEFRTPLTIISGMMEQIKRDPDIWLEKGGRMINQNTQNLLNLVNQILELQKLDSKELKLNIVQGDVVQYLRYLTESYQTYARSKNIELHFLAAQPSIMMDYDPDKLLRIISNLLSNAIKHTPEKGNVYFHIDCKFSPKVLVGQQPDIGKNPVLILRVEDTGNGIPETDLPHIFDRFFQVDDSMTRKGEGTGIGLALTKEIVKLLDGEISVSSEVGIGSAFLVALPITLEAEVTVGIAQPNLPVLAEEDSPSLERDDELLPLGVDDSKAEMNNQSTLLIIEDNPDVTQYLIACLQDSYQLQTAKNGQEGIDKAIEQIPDLIVSDVMMPIKNGFEVCTTLKEDERTSHIPIILLTAKADLESKISGLKQGADAYLTKPFEPEELLVRLEKLLLLRKKLQARYSSLTLLEQNQSSPALHHEDEFIQKVRQVVNENIDNEDFGIVHLCQAIGMSRTQVHNKIKALTGKSTSIFIRSIRLHQAKELLKTTELSVSEIIYEVGFRNPSYFYRSFSEEFGKVPKEIRSEES